MHRTLLRFALMVACLSGCTHVQLRRSTIRQASTLTELQYQQVLDNLAMFACNPDSLPWHVKIKGGTVQITDLGASAVGGIFGSGDAATSVIPSINAQRTRLGQWDIEPVVDSDELEMLRLAYRKAVTPFDQTVDEDIRFQIWTLVVAYQFRPNSEILLEIVNDGIRLWIRELKEKLESATLDEAFDTSDTGRIRRLNGMLEEVNCAMEALVETQAAQRFPRQSSENKWKADCELLTLVRTLELRPGSRPDRITWASPDEVAYADEFDTRIAVAVGAMQTAANELDSITTESKRIKKVREVIEWVRYMNNETELRRTIQRINPARKEQIVEAKRARQSPIAAKLLPISDQDLTDSTVHADVMRLFSLVGSWKYFIAQTAAHLDPRNPGLSDQAQTKVDSLKALYDEGSPLRQPWLCVGQKCDVPCNACYVGHYHNCDSDVYVWVPSDGLKTLSEFTLIVQSLTAIEKQDSFSGRGASFSPGLH